MKEEMLHIRIDKDLKEKLQKMADNDNRKLGDFIRVQLMKIIDTLTKKK
jgi:antitoxin component of RelBE/YafQ-DinJ toxin-antitoxin module